MVTGGFRDYDAGMNSSLRRLALLLLTAAFFALAATGCQTTKGFGKDVEKLGDKIQDKAS
jgi:predicted small secreted protein